MSSTQDNKVFPHQKPFHLYKSSTLSTLLRLYSVQMWFCHMYCGTSAVEDGVGPQDAPDLLVGVTVLVSQVTTEEIQVT